MKLVKDGEEPVIESLDVSRIDVEKFYAVVKTYGETNKILPMTMASVCMGVAHAIASENGYEFHAYHPTEDKP